MGGGGGGLTQPVTLMSAVVWAPPAQYNQERLGDPGSTSHRLLALKIFLQFFLEIKIIRSLFGLASPGHPQTKNIRPCQSCQSCLFVFWSFHYLSSIYPFKIEPRQVEFKIERHDWQRLPNRSSHQIERLIFYFSEDFLDSKYYMVTCNTCI